jgi:ABC-type sugar transport system substrate-binding protein
MRTRFAALIGSLALAAAAGCSSGSDAATPSGPAEGKADQTKAAQKAAAPFLKPATSLNIDTPLKEAPAKGKHVYWLEGNNGGAAPITPGFKAATAALGWRLTVLSYDPADPQSASSALQQAVSQKADFIASSGLEAALLGQGLEAAKKAGIPVFQIATLDEAGEKANGIYAVVNRSEQIKSNMAGMAAYTVADSQGAAKVLNVTLPDYKILATAADDYKSALTSGCSECTYDQLGISLQEFVSGGVPSQVVSYLQTHPDVNYLMLSLGALSTGVDQALQTAGLKKRVKVIGAAPALANVQGLIDGKENAWILLPEALQAWYVVDAMARLSEGMDLEPIQTANLPVEIWTSTNVPKPAHEYDGPADYATTWKALWHVS